jgi:DNA repair protein RadC
MSEILSVREHERAVTLLRAFFGDEAVELFNSHGQSLARVLHAARESNDPRMWLLGQAHAIAEAAALEEAMQRDVLSSPEVVTQFLHLHFAGQPHESFVLLYLDAANRLIAAEELFRGTLAQTSVYPREVVKRVLHHNAAAVICSHCHPSGMCEPSRADEYLTTALKQALVLVDVRLLDHIVIAGNGHVSFATRGLL